MSEISNGQVTRTSSSSQDSESKEQKLSRTQSNSVGSDQPLMMMMSGTTEISRSETNNDSEDSSQSDDEKDSSMSGQTSTSRASSVAEAKKSGRWDSEIKRLKKNKNLLQRGERSLDDSRSSRYEVSAEEFDKSDPEGEGQSPNPFATPADRFRIADDDHKPEVEMQVMGGEFYYAPPTSHGFRDFQPEPRLFANSPEWLELLYKNSCIYIFLILVGAITACLGFFIDFSTLWLRRGHIFLEAQAFEVGGKGFGYPIYIIYGILLAMLASILTAYVFPEGTGSGIPEIRTILNGVRNMQRFHTFRALFVKVVGLIGALGAGLWVGKVGPYIYISSVISRLVAKPFRIIEQNQILVYQLMGAAAAIGVASTFGSILGGVLFSIEVTSTYYPVRNYWFAAVGCGTGGILFRVIWNSFFNRPIYTSLLLVNYPVDLEFHAIDAAMFIFLGIANGLIAAVFVRLHTFILTRRKKYMNTTPWSWILKPMPWTFWIALFTSIVAYPRLVGNFLGLSSYPVLQDLINTGPLGDNGEPGRDGPIVPYTSDQWDDNIGVIPNLVLFFILRFIITAFAITVGTPAGLFVPTLLIGAGFGRLTGEIVRRSLDFDVVPGGYALVGGAAMVGALTQTYSTTAVVLEMTGSLVYSLPVIIATTISIGVAKLFALSIYSEQAKARGLPFLDELRYWRYNNTAEMVMRTDFLFLLPKMTLNQIQVILNTVQHNTFPVINNRRERRLIGQVDRSYLESLLQETKPMKKPKHLQLLHKVKRSSTMIFDPQSYKNKQEVLDKLADEVTLAPAKNVDYDSKIELDIDECPIHFLRTTVLSDIHMLFINLRMSRGFVTDEGRLIGTISRAQLQKSLQLWANEHIQWDWLSL